MNARLVVAIPARDEAERIGACLLSLAEQTVPPDWVLVVANNCTDETASIAESLEPQLPFRLEVVRHFFPSSIVSAGLARRLAMRCALFRAAEDGILLTTDADCVVPPVWIERNRLAIAAGADVVCGRIVVDPLEAAHIPEHLQADDALECELAELLDRMMAWIDPDPADPWPRHTEAAGASIAVSAAAFARTNGIPALRSGEDRAFIQELARLDARIRHEPTITVTVSGRTAGRAPGGMADTIRRRILRQDRFTDSALEPAVDAYRRVDFRRRVRAAWHTTPSRQVCDQLAADVGIAEPLFMRLLTRRRFGAAWADIEACSPFLFRRRVRFVDLPREIHYARELLQACAAPSAA